MIKYLSLFLLFLVPATTSLCAQEETATTDNQESIPKMSYLSLDAMYSTNSSAGSIDPTVNASAYMEDISFYHKSDIWASFMPVLYPFSEETSLDMDMSLGYTYYADNGFNIGAYYMNHYYRGDSALRGIDYQHMLDFSLGYTVGGLYLYADVYPMLGSETFYFSDAGLGYYKYWYWGKTGNWSFSVFPMMSFNAGTDNWLFQGLTTEERASLITDIQLAGYAAESFDYQGLDIIIPANIGYGGFSVGFSFIYSVIANKYKAVGMTNQSGFMFSADFMIPF